VSGGADSVALCELCFQAGFHFEIAHCNFQLRGVESERDEKFVRQLAEKYWTKVFVKKFDTKKYSEENKISIQVAARDLRYEWFKELLNNQQMVLIKEQSTMSNAQLIVPKKLSANNHQASTFLLTAHHANDNIETLLMNFFKGTGVNGLHGILPKNGKFVRPLLFAKKEEIISFLKDNNLDFVEDSSNNSDKYTRNYFRNQLIPSIQKVFPQVEENLLKNIERFKEIEILYVEAIDLQKKKLIEKKGNEIQIPILKLLKTKPLKTVVYEIIKEYGFTAHQAEEVIDLLKSESGKYICSATYKIIKNRKWLIIAPNNTLEASHILINETDKEIVFELGELRLKREPLNNIENAKAEIIRAKANHHSEAIATLDARQISFPLLLRKWKEGDYFYPLGMQKKKKLNKFFIDQKLSLTDKEKIWIIESNKKIIWIIGKRIDDRFKITDNTKDILSIDFSKS